VEIKAKKVLKEYYGSFSTPLEREYENKIVQELLTSDLEGKRKWATFNQVIVEVKVSGVNKLSELLYRITDGEDPVKCCIDILEPMVHMTAEMERLYTKIKLF